MGGGWKWLRFVSTTRQFVGWLVSQYSLFNEVDRLSNYYLVF